MPGCFRYSLDLLLEELQEVVGLGLGAIALFPLIPDAQKDNVGTESYNPTGLIPQTLRAIKQAFPQLLVITDVALDPYSSVGHDGIVQNGQILNDETVEVLVKQALAQAEAGADMVAPSDMMDVALGPFAKPSMPKAGSTSAFSPTLPSTPPPTTAPSAMPWRAPPSLATKRPTKWTPPTPPKPSKKSISISRRG